MSDGDYKQGEGTLSIEGVLVESYFKAITRLQDTWMNEENVFRRKQFNLQILMLIRMIPDKKRQLTIMGEWDEVINSLKDSNLERDEVIAFAGMEAVTEIVMFICNAFELINTDITGPATSKEYRDAVLQIPDLPGEDSGVDPEDELEADVLIKNVLKIATAGGDDNDEEQ